MTIALFRGGAPEEVPTGTEFSCDATPPAGAVTYFFRNASRLTTCASGRVSSAASASLAAGLEVGGDRGFALAQRQEFVRTFEDDFEAAKASSIWEQRRESMLRSEYTYGPLTGSEILAYLRFLHAPAGKRFHHLLEVVTTAVIMEGGESLAVALAALLNEASN